MSDIRCTDSKLLINKKEINEIISHGHEIGSHTHTHRTLSKLDLPQLIEEIDTNLEILNKIGAEINNFAIPYGMRRLIKNEHIPYLQTKFNSIAFGEPGMLHHQEIDKLQRYPDLVQEYSSILPTLSESIEQRKLRRLRRKEIATITQGTVNIKI